MTQFSVCMLCNDDVEIIDKFITFYLQNGADEILLYLDFNAPEPDYSQIDKVTVIKTESIFVVDGQPKRPKNFHQFQRAVYTDAFRRFSTDWLLICDVDEFVVSDRSLTDVLHDVPRDWQFFRIPVAEAIWGPDDAVGMPFKCTYFRTRAPKGLGKLLSLILYGKSYRFTNAGLMGHSVGKYFIRKGSTHALGIHMPQGLPWTQGPWIHDMVPDPNMFVYHFEAISYDRWLFKWNLRTKISRAPKKRFNAAKHAYMTAFNEHQKSGTERDLFNSVYQINSWQVTILRVFGLLRKRQLW